MEKKSLGTKLQELKTQLIKTKEEAGLSSGWQLDAINYACEEIDSPHPVDKGKYKIPRSHFYNAASVHDSSPDIEGVISALDEFKRFDGLFTEEQGQLLESFYEDKDNYLYLHNICYRHTHSAEELEEIYSNICKNGLRLTGSGNELGRIDYTTVSSKGSSMVALMPTWDAQSGIIILKLPKDKIDNNEPIIGSDKNEPISTNNVGYVLPEYVVGYLSDGKFIENPVPLAERENRYKFKFSENINGPSEDSSFEPNQ